MKLFLKDTRENEKLKKKSIQHMDKRSLSRKLKQRKRIPQLYFKKTVLKLEIAKRHTTAKLRNSI